MDNGGNILDLSRKCKNCQISLTTANAAKKNARYYLSQCKPCRSKKVIQWMKGNLKRQAYMRCYIRKIGLVKEYPCETCQTPCFKKYARAFCCDKCRFVAYVKKDGECWLWIGTKNRRGYGKLCFGTNKTAVASRVSYELFKGPIEKGKLICHTCDMPACVNPDHLWVGTHVENMIDMVDKGRQSKKLRFEDILQIRKLRESGACFKQIQERFKITSGHLSNIIARRIWRHV